MSINFSKYHGTGNDFILIDGYTTSKDKSVFSKKVVRAMCDRRFGIGADGLMILKQSEVADFEMVYFNSDGNESSMCGNGGRCIVAFAQKLGVIDQSATFVAVDGLHSATIDRGIVNLSMIDVDLIDSRKSNVFVLDTGSPHYVEIAEGINTMDLIENAHGIRYNEEFKATGINVNYIEQLDNKWSIRTYERGVEAETYSCGTGVTAAALAIAQFSGITNQCTLITQGGELTVFFKKDIKGYSNIVLSGPASHVYDGVYAG